MEVPMGRREVVTVVEGLEIVLREAVTEVMGVILRGGEVVVVLVAVEEIDEMFREEEMLRGGEVVGKEMELLFAVGKAREVVLVVG